MGDWKAVKLNVDKDPDGPIELYNLASDPGETKDVAAGNPDVVKKFFTLMGNARTTSDIFPFAYEKLK